MLAKAANDGLPSTPGHRWLIVSNARPAIRNQQVAGSFAAAGRAGPIEAKGGLRGSDLRWMVARMSTVWMGACSCSSATLFDVS
jgi:hypothetical protein